MATFTPPAFKASELVDLIHKLPHIGNADFSATIDGDAFVDYWVMSVGVLAGGVTALLLLCGIFMWIFTCCFCCKCCQRRCYCARCCCCKGSRGKLFYAILLCLSIGSLYFGASSRTSAIDMINNMSDAMKDTAAIIDVINEKLAEYAAQFGDMKTAVDAAKTSNDCSDDLATSLSDLLKKIQTAMEAVKLPIDSTVVDPMIKYLATSDTFPPDFDKILGDGYEGILSFMFDGGLAAMALYIILLAFFACFANYRSKCSDKGCGRCIKCIYIFLVLFFGSLFIVLNIALSSAMMGTAVAISDLCAANPDTAFGSMFIGDGILADAGMDDVLYWTTCKGTNPTTNLTDAIDKPLNKLSNMLGNGKWDDIKNSQEGCYTATKSIGEHCGESSGTAGLKACKSSGTEENPVVTYTVDDRDGSQTNAMLCTSRQTIEDFKQLFGCPEGDYTAPSGRKVPSGGINSVYQTFVYKALCTDMVNTFFYLWLALSASTFFILFAFCVLPCTSRNGGASKKGSAEADDTKA